MIRKLIQVMALFFLVELIVMIWIGGKLGVLNTISLLVLSAVIGLMIARSQGLVAFRTAQQQMALGNPPGHTILNGVLILIGAVLLIFPGFLSDILGILLFVPITRKWFHQLIFIWLRDRVGRRYH